MSLRCARTGRKGARLSLLRLAACLLAIGTAVSASPRAANEDDNDTEYAREMQAGAAAYRHAWSLAVANSSSAFRDSMMASMRHFRRALGDGTDEAAFWNLAISIAYMQSRGQLVDASVCAGTRVGIMFSYNQPAHGHIQGWWLNSVSGVDLLRAEYHSSSNEMLIVGRFILV